MPWCDSPKHQLELIANKAALAALATYEEHAPERGTQRI